MIKIKHTRESAIQADDDDYSNNYKYMMIETDTILNAFNKAMGKFFNFPNNRTSRQCETIRSSRKGFRLNEPAAFHENLPPHRSYIPAKAILPPLSKIDKLYNEEVFRFSNETVVQIYVDGPEEKKEEFMKVYLDNEPTQQIVQSEESEWRLLPMRKTTAIESKVIETLFN